MPNARRIRITGLDVAPSYRRFHRVILEASLRLPRDESLVHLEGFSSSARCEMSAKPLPPCPPLSCLHHHLPLCYHPRVYPRAVSRTINHCVATPPIFAFLCAGLSTIVFPPWHHLHHSAPSLPNPLTGCSVAQVHAPASSLPRGHHHRDCQVSSVIADVPNESTPSLPSPLRLPNAPHPC